jgi:hypothetical protein
MLLLLGSFTFVFLLGEAVHELGHFLAHRAYGVEVGIRLDPFGGSRILHGSNAPNEIMGITSLAGPLFNLLVGITVSLILWRKRNPWLLPLVLWGPVALVQEGVTFSLGMLTPGGDAQLIVDWGVPMAVLLGLGILFLFLGVAWIGGLLPLVNLSPSDSFLRKFAVVAGGMISFMVIRLLGSLLNAPNLLLENTVPLAFAFLLATLVVLLHRPLAPIFQRLSASEVFPVTRSEVVFALALGLGMILIQMMVLP